MESKYSDHQTLHLFDWASGKTSLQINSNVKCQVFNANEILTNEASWASYEYNRPVDHKRVDVILKQQEMKFRETKRFDFYFNPLVVCQHLDKFYLIDGQHRVATLKQMKLKYKDYLQDIQCLVIFITCATAEDMAYNFERVNSGTPLPASYYNQKVSSILANYCAWLEKQHKSVISPSSAPRRPHFNLDIVKKEISLNEKFKLACAEGKITTETLIKATMMELELAQEMYLEYEVKQLSDAINKKIKSSKFYLGKDKMNVWIPKIINRARKIMNDVNV